LRGSVVNIADSSLAWTVGTGVPVTGCVARVGSAQPCNESRSQPSTQSHVFSATQLPWPLQLSAQSGGGGGRVVAAAVVAVVVVVVVVVVIGAGVVGAGVAPGRVVVDVVVGAGVVGAGGRWCRRRWRRRRHHRARRADREPDRFTSSSVPGDKGEPHSSSRTTCARRGQAIASSSVGCTPGPDRHLRGGGEARAHQRLQR
jgi:hypothetical protein